MSTYTVNTEIFFQIAMQAWFWASQGKILVYYGKRRGGGEMRCVIDSRISFLFDIQLILIPVHVVNTMQVFSYELERLCNVFTC